MQFFIVDVFAEQKYSGNQLAVFLCPTMPDTTEMQAAAREIHFSESVFILSGLTRGDGASARIFTPAHEVDFAGHPTLGAAYIVREKILQRPLPRVTLDLPVGRIAVDFPANPHEPLWMDQVEPVFGERLAVEDLAEVLGLPPAAFDPTYPIEQVSTGLPHIIVPLRSLEYLRAARVDRAAYFRFIEHTWAKNILVFSPEPYHSGHHIGVRMFADYLGIPEDAATGSGNGCLAGYLVRHRCCGAPEVAVTVGQGYEIGRPSQLFLRTAERGGRIHISVGGRVVEIAAGEWR